MIERDLKADESKKLYVEKDKDLDNLKMGIYKELEQFDW